jgi:hypothetical protein
MTDDRDGLVPRLRKARAHAGLVASRTAHRAGIRLGSVRSTHLLARDWTSPIVDADRVPASAWRRKRLAGISIDEEAQFRSLESEHAEAIAEFDFPREAGSSAGSPSFYLDNGFYGRVDAELLWAMIRRLKPRRIVELGSGFSTLLMASACLANAREGDPAELFVFNPFPEPLDFGARPIPGVTSYEATGAQDVPDAVLAELGEGDILFVDTSHVVKLGGDTVSIVLEKMPAVGAGTYIHFHDVFIPWEYPAEWVREFDGFPYAEQYLVQAFLAYNRDFDVHYAAYALARHDPERLHGLIPSFREGVIPRAFWIRRHRA